MLILPPCCLGTCSCQCVLRFFHSTLSKVLRLPRKSDARSYEVLHLSRKIISANLKICLMLQNAPPLRKSAPGPPNSSDEHVSCTAPATEKCIFADPLQMSHACHRFWKCYKARTFCSLLTRCTIPCACHAKRHSETFSFLIFFLLSLL